MSIRIKLPLKMNKKLVNASAVFAKLEAGISVGPGFANHPADCALGIAWADCLPGTRGYANGGGSLHRKEATEASDAQRNSLAALFEAGRSRCEADMAVVDLNPLRDTIQSGRKLDSLVPYASLDLFPTAVERPLSAKRATLRDTCIEREHAIR
ncbi:hypothetical protein ACMX25_31555 [Caballeronia sp. 15715]|uniref:hypothetical protein n=1 Tax=Caballeronia sp. 15715 TaxID=3391030 RepID=UPI0039E627D9